MLPERGDGVQNLLELGAPLLVATLLHVAYHLPHHLLEAGALAGVEGDLQLSYLVDVRHEAVHPATHAEDLEVGDHALAVPEQLHDVLHGEARGAEHHAVAGVDLGELLHELVGGKAPKLRQPVQIFRDGQLGEFRVQIGIEPLVLDGVGADALEAGLLLEHLFGLGAGRQLGQGLAPGVNGGADELEEALGEPRHARVAASKKVEEVVGPQRRNLDGVLGGIAGAQDVVPDREDLEHHLALPVHHVPALVREGPHLVRGEEFEKVLVGGEAARGPEHVDEAPPEGHAELEADADADADDGGCRKYLPGSLDGHAVVVDDGQGLDALDPGVHDEVRGTFAALGVHVVDMVVEGDLVPGLVHLRQVVALEEPAHDARRALGGGPEVVGQLELALLLAVGAHDALHNLHEHAGRVAPQGRVGAAQDLVVEHLEAQEAVSGLDAAGLEVAEQVGHRIGHAGHGRVHQLLDAVRV